MFVIRGAPRRLPRSGLSDRWVSAACKDALATAAVTAAILSAGWMLLDLGYSFWEPEKSTAGWGWFIAPFVVGSVFGAFARRAPLTRGSLLAELGADLVGFLLGAVALSVLAHNGLIALF